MADADKARVALEVIQGFLADDDDAATVPARTYFANRSDLIRAALAERATTAAGEPTKLPDREALEQIIEEALAQYDDPAGPSRPQVVKSSTDAILALSQSETVQSGGAGEGE